MNEMVLQLHQLPPNGLEISKSDGLLLGKEQDLFWLSYESKNPSGVAHALDALTNKLTRFVAKGLDGVLDGEKFITHADSTTPNKMWRKISNLFTPEACAQHWEEGQTLLFEVYNKYHGLNKGVSVSETQHANNFDLFAKESIAYFFNLGKLFDQWFAHEHESYPLFIQKNQWDLRYRYGALARAFEETSDIPILLDIFSALSNEDLEYLSLKSLKLFIEKLMEDEEFQKAKEILQRTQPLFEKDYEHKFGYHRSIANIHYSTKQYENAYLSAMEAFECTKKSGTWDARYTESVGFCLRSAICSQNDIGGLFDDYLIKSQEFNDQMSIYSLNLQVLKFLRSVTQRKEQRLNRKIQSLLSESKISYSPKHQAYYFFQCAKDIFEWGEKELTELGLEYARKSLVIYKEYGRFSIMENVLSLLIENETNEYIKPDYEDELNQTKRRLTELDGIIELPVEGDHWEWDDVDDDTLRKNRQDLENFYQASIKLNHTLNIEVLLRNTPVGKYSDWNIIHAYDGSWSKLYSLTGALKTFKEPQYNKDLVDHVAHIEVLYQTIGTSFAETIALESLVKNPNFVHKDKYLPMLNRLNDLLSQQGSERLRHINLERIARLQLLNGDADFGKDLFRKIIEYWKKDYPQNALYSTENFVTSLLQKDDRETALEVILSLHEQDIYDLNQLIALSGLEALCYLKKGKQYWIKGIAVLKKVTPLILQKKYINTDNQGTYNQILSMHFGLLHLINEDEAKNALSASIQKSDFFDLSGVIQYSINKYIVDFVKPRELIPLMLEKAQIDFEEEEEEWGFNTLSNLCNLLLNSNSSEFMPQSENYLKLAMEKGNIEAVVHAVKIMRKVEWDFSAEHMQSSFLNTTNLIIEEYGSDMDKAYYWHAISVWYKNDKRETYLRQAFEIFDRLSVFGMASWCLSDLYKAETKSESIIIKLEYDVKHNLRRAVMKGSIPRIMKQMNNLDIKNSQKIILLLTELLVELKEVEMDKEEVKLDNRIQHLFKKLCIHQGQLIQKLYIHQRNYEKVFDLLEEDFNLFSFEKKTWHLGQNWLKRFTSLAPHYEDKKMLELLNKFIGQLEHYHHENSTRYWSLTLREAKKIHQKMSKSTVKSDTLPDENLYHFQKQIITESTGNPKKAKELLRVLIQKYEKHIHFEKHLKSLLNKAKNTEIEEIILKHFIANSEEKIEAQNWQKKLFNYYQNTQLTKKELEMLTEQVALANTKNDIEYWLNIFIERILEVSLENQVNEIKQVMSNKSINKHKTMLKLIKSKITSELRYDLIVALANAYLVQEEFDVAIQYYKRLLISPNTSESQHALYVYRVALSEVGRNRLEEAKEWFFNHITVEENEETLSYLRSNFGIFLLEIGDQKGYDVLRNISKKEGQQTVFGKGHNLEIEENTLSGLPDKSRLEIEESQLHQLSKQVKKLSTAAVNRNDVYAIILNEENKVIDLKLPAYEPCELNFSKPKSKPQVTEG